MGRNEKFEKMQILRSKNLFISYLVSIATILQLTTYLAFSVIIFYHLFKKNTYHIRQIQIRLYSFG